jgi:hypothetical protein
LRLVIPERDLSSPKSLPGARLTGDLLLFLTLALISSLFGPENACQALKISKPRDQNRKVKQTRDFTSKKQIRQNWHFSFPQSVKIETVRKKGPAKKPGLRI